MNDTLKAVIVEVSGDNLRNDHINLHGTFGLFPDDSIGGSNRDSAVRPFTLVIGHDPVETDIDGTNAIFRERAAIRRFFDKERVAEGDLLLIERMGDREYHLTKTSKRVFKYHL